jgi:hypothetical protein
MVLNPQNPGNYPPPGNQQYLQAPNAQPAPVQQAPVYQQPQQQPQLQWQQGPQPAPYNPNRVVPPQRVGSKANADQTVTGSIKNRKYYKEVPEPKKNLPKAIPGEDNRGLGPLQIWPLIGDPQSRPLNILERRPRFALVRDTGLGRE